LPIKAEVKAESSDVLKTVDEDRKYVIQATIVRYVAMASRNKTRNDDVCGLQDHEGSQDVEEPGADPGGCCTNLATVLAQDSRHQEGEWRCDSVMVKAKRMLQAIETLLEKEYIERVAETRDTFAYVA
jgi:cullin 1